ncbi:hypothetical protein PVL29_011053 [Vitis rotundifolia]|uniref:Glycosyltransferase N-terminal domain-containing protein n=1 Tax=Vitis rotundifolia TaxID=103349 RepID=A0AA39DVR9_VITRO|nr:hypothetical protein PVL29_011053 [Vitis rotundifolia]
MDNTKIHFQDFSMPPFLSPLPNPNASNKCSAHLQPSIEASMHLRQPVSALFPALSPTTKRMIIIHDPLIASVVRDATSIPNAEAYVFHCALLFPFSPTCEKPWENLFHPCFTFEIMNFSAHQYEFAKTAVGDLYNTCRLTEGTHIDILANEQMNGNKKQWAIGPLNPVTIYRHRNSNNPQSVVYISFGTSRVEAMGLGMVVRDWAPPQEILGHVSTGGFMSHCGWNSCMESITTGVPIAAWPMHSDQPQNIFREWEHQEELVTSSTIEKARRRLMASKEGNDVRKRALELGGAIWRSMDDRGASCMELDSFIAHISR